MIQSLPPKAISFDLDDTLWPCADVIERAERKLYAWLVEHYPAIPAAYSREEMRQARLALASRRTDLAADLSRLRRVSLQQHAREVGYPPDLAEAAIEVFLAERHCVNLYPDVLPLLERLRGQVPLIALTNGNACVKRVGIGDYFDLSLSAADVGAAKPDPAMFRAACEHLSLRPNDLLHVGDDPLRDVHAARSLGARTIWVNRAGASWPTELAPAAHEVTDLGALEHVSGLAGRG